MKAKVRNYKLTSIFYDTCKNCYYQKKEELTNSLNVMFDETIILGFVEQGWGAILKTHCDKLGQLPKKQLSIPLRRFILSFQITQEIDNSFSVDDDHQSRKIQTMVPKRHKGCHPVAGL